MLCKFISALASAKCRVSPWWVWFSKCPHGPGSTESPTGSGGNWRVLGQGALLGAQRCSCSYCCCRRMNFGNSCSKGSWAAVKRRNAAGLLLQRWFGVRRCITDSLPLLGTGLSGRQRRTKDELISPHLSWWTERFLLHLVSNTVQPPPTVHSNLASLPLPKVKFANLTLGKGREANEAWDNPKSLLLRCQSYLSPVGSRQGQVQEPWCLWRGRNLSSQRETPQVLPAGSGPSLAASLSFAQQHSTAGARTDTQPSPAMAGCPAVLGKWWSVILSLPGRQHVGRTSPSPKLAHCPPCCL